MKAHVLALGLSFFSLYAFNQNYDTGHYKLKLDEVNKSLAGDPRNLALYYARADIYDLLDDFQNAGRDYLKVIELYQQQPDGKYLGEYAKSCYRLADDYFFRSSNREKAMKYVKKGLEAGQNLKDLEILEAIILGSDPEMGAEAGEKFKILSGKYPEDIRLKISYARFLEKNSPVEAAALYEKVLDADPLNKEVLLSLGTIYNNEATRLSEAVISDPAIIFDYARKAADCFEKLYKLNPSDMELTNVLLRLYVELDQKEKAKLLSPNAPY